MLLYPLAPRLFCATDDSYIGHLLTAGSRQLLHKLIPQLTNKICPSISVRNGRAPKVAYLGAVWLGPSGSTQSLNRIPMCL